MLLEQSEDTIYDVISGGPPPIVVSRSWVGNGTIIPLYSSSAQNNQGLKPFSEVLIKVSLT